MHKETVFSHLMSAELAAKQAAQAGEITAEQLKVFELATRLAYLITHPEDDENSHSAWIVENLPAIMEKSK